MASTSRESRQRVPWATAALVALLAAGFAWSELSKRELHAVASARLERAERYWAERPYLEAPDVLATRVSEDRVNAERWSFEQREGSATVFPRLRVREQGELERLASAASNALASLPESRLGLRPDDPDPTTLLGHLVVHAGPLHAVGNLLLIALLGAGLEAAWGGPMLALVMLLSALAAASAFALAGPPVGAVYVGTSGLLAGLVAAHAVRALTGAAERSTGALRVAGADGASGVLPVAGLAFLGLPLAVGADWSLAPSFPTGGTSAWALLGGVGCGVLAVGALRALGLDAAGGDADPELARALADLAAGRPADAHRRLNAIVARGPADRAALLALWSAARELGRDDEARRALLRVIREEVQRGEGEAALEHWRALGAAGLEPAVEPALAIRLAGLLIEADCPDEAVGAFRAGLRGCEGEASAPVAARLARAAEAVAPEVAADAAWRALSCSELDLFERQDLERLLLRLRAQLGRRAAEPEAQPAPAETAELAETRPDPIEIGDAGREIDVVDAVPLELDATGLCIRVAPSIGKRVRYERIDAVCVVAVEGISAKPVIVVDLLLNWSAQDEPLRVIRLRGDRFDPCKLCAEPARPVDALRDIVDRLLAASEARPLPDLRSARGRPFAGFASLEDYERDVLTLGATTP
jgi:membrane associated rhomboid family serine protease